MIALRALGIVAIVADSFAPGFWWGETHNGFPLIAIPGIASRVAVGDAYSLDWRDSLIRIGDEGRQYVGADLSPHQINVIEAGGAYNLLLQQHSALAH